MKSRSPRQLAAEAAKSRNELPQRSLLLAIESLRANSKVVGNRIAAADGTLREVLATTQGLPLPEFSGNPTSLGFSSDSRWIAAGSDDGTVHLHNLETVKDNPVVFTAHHEGVRALAFSQDGQRLATISKQGNARLWAHRGIRRRTHRTTGV